MVVELEGNGDPSILVQVYEEFGGPSAMQRNITSCPACVEIFERMVVKIGGPIS